jgi:hypothetical protein
MYSSNRARKEEFGCGRGRALSKPPISYPRTKTKERLQALEAIRIARHLYRVGKKATLEALDSSYGCGVVGANSN